MKNRTYIAGQYGPPPYFVNIEFDTGRGYLVYARKDTGRRVELGGGFGTYEEARLFAARNAGRLPVKAV